MIKLLIIDDEPLVITGIKSMLNWGGLGIEICGTASNGSQALGFIEKYQPELVISDIKMPIMNGLKLAKTCNERYGKLPLFILLTSYDEFELVREAIRYDVVDYLIKLELNKDMLTSSVKKALSIVDEIQLSLPPDSRAPSKSVQSFQENFFISLLNNTFEDKEQIENHMKELNLDLTSSYYIACYCKVIEFDGLSMSKEKKINLFESTLQMVREIASRYIPCHVISLDMKDNNLKIYEIADQLGFDNAFYFSKVFKKVEGCSPSEYQQTNQKIGW
ncbi:MAG: response regulator [Clostridiales bacterium]|nr:response regulator [Clostridiales bacterium]